MNLGGICSAANLANCGPAELTAYDSPGSLWHTLLGIGAAMLPGAWQLSASTAFGAYELSKADGGKPFSEIAGAFLEFAIGLGIGALILMYMGER